MSSMRRAVSASIACVAAVTAEAAAQQPVAQPPAVETIAPAVPQQEVHARAWEQAFRQAFLWMKQGRFFHAEAQFAYLAATASRPEDRRSALQYRALCAHQGGRQQVWFGSKASRWDDRRTGEEIALLYTHAALYGLGAGFVIAQVHKPSNAMEYTLPTVAAIGAATSTVAVLDAGNALGFGEGQALAAGTQVGLAEGIAFVSVRQARVEQQEEWTIKTNSALVLGTTTLGAVFGGLAGSGLEATPGQSSYVSSAAIWGGVLGGSIGSTLASSDLHDQNRVSSLSGLVGVNAGLLVGALSAGSVSPSPDRMRFVDLGGLLGLLTGLGAYAIAGNPGEAGAGRALYGSIGATTASGLGIAWLATANMPPQPRPRENLVTHVQPAITPSPGGLTIGISGML
jgi:hypothetical protein